MGHPDGVKHGRIWGPLGKDQDSGRIVPAAPSRTAPDSTPGAVPAGQMPAFDTDFRLNRRVVLNVAVICAESYFESTDFGSLMAAEELLEKHNIGLRIWPTDLPGDQSSVGVKQNYNTLLIGPVPKDDGKSVHYDEPIPHKPEAYKQLRKDVNWLIQNRGGHGATGYPALVPVVFCQFDHRGHGVAPPDTKLGAADAPACLISPNPQADRMTVLHEMGHAAGLHHQLQGHEKNVMHTLDGRENLYRFQVEAFSKCIFARSAS